MKRLPATLLLFVSLFVSKSTLAETSPHPKDIEFKRQAVRRMIFDTDQAIPLGALRPATIRDFDLMHPELRREESDSSLTDWEIEKEVLSGTSGAEVSRSLRWVGGFNAFATYDLAVKKCEGNGFTGIYSAEQWAAENNPEDFEKAAHWMIERLRVVTES